MPAKQPKAQYPFFFALLLGVLAVTAFIFLPYAITLAVAVTIAVVTQPLYRAMLRIWKGRTALASLSTIVVTAIVILVPVTILGSQVVQEAQKAYQALNADEPFAPLEIVQSLEDLIQSYVPQFSIDLQGPIKQSFEWLASHAGSFFAGTVGTVVSFFLGIIALYYLLKDGDEFIEKLVRLSPLTDTHDHAILDRLVTAINSIVKGSLLIALIQGVVSGIGFAIFGLPSPTLWGMLAGVGALVPGVGTAIVAIPAVLYLFFAAELWQAIGLAIWASIAVGAIDNLLGPTLVGKGVKIHPLFILFAVIGGLQLFGPLGFILGPLVLSLLFALLDIYKLYYEQTVSKSKRS